MTLRWLEGEEGDLWRAVEAEGNAYGAYAPVDVELHSVEAEVAFDVFFTHGGKDERAEEWEAYLASVRVAGEHEVDEWATRVFGDDVGVVRLVRHEDDGGLRGRGDGEVEVRETGGWVGYAGEPEAVAFEVDGEVLVDQDGRVVGGEGLDDERGAEGDVVVAEDGVALGRGEGGEDFGAAVGGGAGVEGGEDAAGDEVSGEEDEVWVEGVGVADDSLEEAGFGVLDEVDVAELGDGEAVEGGGEVVDGDGAVDDVDLVAGDLAGVKGKARGGGTAADEEVPPGQSLLLDGEGDGHTFMITAEL